MSIRTERDEWPEKYKRSIHKIFGSCQTWVSSSGQYKITRYVNSSTADPFIVTFCDEGTDYPIWVIVGRGRTLNSAQTIAHDHKRTRLARESKNVKTK